MTERRPEWLFEYQHDGETYGMTIVAADEADARRRLASCASWGRLKGQVEMTVRIGPPWLQRVAVFLARIFGRQA